MAKKLVLTNQNQINADIALKSRLYVSGYMLSGLLVAVRNGGILADVVLHYDQHNVPVGVAVSVTDRAYVGYETMVFVRKSKRRQGIGTILLDKLNGDRKQYVGIGCSASRNFWNKNGYHRQG
jgi:GNAT superfamily N-acetyltransferase